MKERIFLILCFFILATFSRGQTPSWLWARKGTGGGADYAQGIASDASSNVLVTGYFQSATITFGNITLANADNSGSSADIFVVKYDASGNVLWAQRAGGTGYDVAYSVSTDANGNIFVTGYFLSQSIVFGNITLYTAGGYNIFIVKYDPSGNVLWAKREGGPNDEFGIDVQADPAGNVLLTGSFNDPTVTFGSTTLFNADNTGNSMDLFVVKYNSSGNVLWAKRAGGSSDEWGQSINTDTSGNVLVGGYFASASISFGSSTLTNADNSGNTFDAFTAKYDAAGNVLWERSAGGSSDDAVMDIVSDAAGNTLITGLYKSPAVTFGSTTLTNPDNSGVPSDIFTVKYDGLGNVLWAKGAGEIFSDAGFSITSDPAGNAYVTGYFQGQVIFGSDTVTAVNWDLFIVKYDVSGNVVWSKGAGGTGWEYGQSICYGTGGNLWVTGIFDSPNITFGSNNLTNSGSDDAFVCRLGTATGLNDQGELNSILTVFPNPSSGVFTVKSAGLGVRRLDIYNMLGEKVYSTEPHPSNSELNLSDKPKGIYFLRLQGEKQMYTSKIVIE